MSYTNLSLVEERILDNDEREIAARVDIPPGTVIGIYDGEIREFAVKEGRILDADAHKYIVQIALEGDVLFGLVSAPDAPFYGIDFINHSCHPNVVARDRVTLVAADAIKAGQRLTIDYRDWDLIPEGIPCWCSPSRCTI
jgi:uncharacterized protein